MAGSKNGGSNGGGSNGGGSKGGGSKGGGERKPLVPLTLVGQDDEIEPGRGV